MAFSFFSKASELISGSMLDSYEESEGSDFLNNYFFGDMMMDDTWKVDNSPPCDDFSPISSSNSSPPPAEFPSIPEMPTITSPPPLFECDLKEVKKEQVFSSIRTSSCPKSSSTVKNLKSEARQEDERQLKRQRRLIKNRESAQLSRLRKKIYIEDLEKKVAHLSAQNEALVQQVQTITTEKKKLADEVTYLHSVIKQQPCTSPSAPRPVTTTSRFGVSAPQRRTNYKAAGVCLLLVLFSFGLLFNAAKRQEKTVTLEPTKSEKIPDTNLGKRWNATSSFVESLSETPLQSVDKHQEKAIEPSIHKKRTRSDLEQDDALDVVPVPVGTSLSKKSRMEVSSVHKNLLPVEKSDRSLVVSTPSRTPMMSSPAPMMSTPSPMTSSPTPMTSSQSQDDMIALLIPSHMLNSSLLAPHLQNSSTPSLQVLRQFLTLYMWPMNSTSS